MKNKTIASKSIKFIEELLPSIRDGSKTVTRRVIKEGADAGLILPARNSGWIAWWPGEEDPEKLTKFTLQQYEAGFLCPYGEPGDHLVVEGTDIELEITGLSVSKVQDIKERDCIAEGVGSPITRDCKKPRFIELWNSIYEALGWGWDKNPWCWVIEFRVLPEKA